MLTLTFTDGSTLQQHGSPAELARRFPLARIEEGELVHEDGGVEFSFTTIDGVLFNVTIDVSRRLKVFAGIGTHVESIARLEPLTVDELSWPSLRPIILGIVEHMLPRLLCVITKTSNPSRLLWPHAAVETSVDLLSRSLL